MVWRRHLHQMPDRERASRLGSAGLQALYGVTFLITNGASVYNRHWPPPPPPPTEASADILW